MSDMQIYVRKAQENIEAANILLEKGFTEIAVSRAYYAMFYIAEGLLFTKGLSFTSHSAVVAAFGREFAKTGVLNPTHHQHLLAAFELRQVGDYVVDREIPIEKANEIISWAKEFLRSAMGLINRENPD